MVCFQKLCLCLVAVLSGLWVSSAAPKAQVNSKDLPYIGCDVCTRALARMSEAVESARKAAPYRKLDESVVQDVLESICEPETETGSWIKKLDIVETRNDRGIFLSLEEPGGQSKCGSECMTIAKSCTLMLEDEWDLDKVSSKLWRGTDSAQDLTKQFCKKRCKSAKPLSKSYKRQDGEFEPMTEKELQMEKLMAEMKASGMGGMNMYNRDDMADMMAGYEDFEDFADGADPSIDEADLEF